MKIVNTPNIIKSIITPIVVAGTFVTLPLASRSQNNLEKVPQVDTFSSITNIPPEGTSNRAVLNFAPNPETFLLGKKISADIVIDLSKNVLYHYKNGNACAAYLVATGKKSTPTEPGIWAVTHIENYPYKSAHPKTKRYKNPKDYGPNIICLEKIDTITGARTVTGQFIHGNNNPSSIGKYVSKGCIRMDNEVIKSLAKKIKRGAFVLIK